MTLPWIKVNGKIYSHEALKGLSFEQELSDFENATLTFCRQWLSGQQEFIVPTSGSTGNPKKITLSRSQMEASARQTIRALKLNGGSALVCLDPAYIAGKMMLVRSLLAGMNIVAVEPSSNPLGKIVDEPIDFAAFVPYQLENIMEHSAEKLNSIRCAIIGGAAVNGALRRKIENSSCHLFATYGMTETLSHIALQALNGPHAKDYFEAFPEIRLRLDSRGCLCITVDYLKEEVITNDLVDLFEERKFIWLGRIDLVINSGGIKVIPEKVEMAFEKILNAHGIGNRFFVAGVPDEGFGNKVALIFEGASFEDILSKEILFEASTLVSKYELPKELIFIPQFKETATGKINRAATMALVAH